VTVYGPKRAAERGAVVAFSVEGAHPHDVAAYLDAEGIAVRAGHHCAQPLMRSLGVVGTSRASFSVYTSPDDVALLIRALARIDAVVAAGATPVCVGGDHSITLGILRSLAKRHGPLGLVHFDAHPDTWDQYFGSKFFHGTPFRRAVEERLVDPRRMIQVGIRGPLYGPEDFAFHDEHGIEVVRIEAVKEHGTAWVAERFARLRGAPVYCSF